MVGVLAIPGPGQGWALVFLALAILSTEFRWAHRARTALWVRLVRARKAYAALPPGRRALVVLGLVLLVAVCLALAWWVSLLLAGVPGLGARPGRRPARPGAGRRLGSRRRAVPHPLRCSSVALRPRAVSSVGRARRSHRRGRWFESSTAHPPRAPSAGPGRPGPCRGPGRPAAPRAQRDRSATARRCVPGHSACCGSTSGPARARPEAVLGGVQVQVQRPAGGQLVRVRGRVHLLGGVPARREADPRPGPGPAGVAGQGADGQPRAVAGRVELEPARAGAVAALLRSRVGHHEVVDGGGVDADEDRGAGVGVRLVRARCRTSGPAPGRPAGRAGPRPGARSSATSPTARTSARSTSSSPASRYVRTVSAPSDVVAAPVRTRTTTRSSRTSTATVRCTQPVQARGPPQALRRRGERVADAAGQRRVDELVAVGGGAAVVVGRGAPQLDHRPVDVGGARAGRAGRCGRRAGPGRA